jgi:hypothetical protein
MAKATQTIEAIFAEPILANIPWRDIESLFRHLGANVSRGSGSRVRVALNGVRATFHRPHPQAEAHKPLVRSVRRFLEAAGEAP